MALKAGGIGVSSDLWDSLLFGRITSLPYFLSLKSFQKYPCQVSPPLLPTPPVPPIHNHALPFHSQGTCISVTWSQSCAHYFSLRCELLFLRVILSAIKAPRLVFSLPCVFNLALCSSMMESGIYLVELRSLLFYCSATWNLEYSLSPSYVLCGGSAVKNQPVNAGHVSSVPGSGRSLEKEMVTHSSILAWEIPWTGKPGRLQFIGDQKKKSVCVYIYMCVYIYNSYIHVRETDKERDSESLYWLRVFLKLFWP